MMSELFPLFANRLIDLPTDQVVRIAVFVVVLFVIWVVMKAILRLTLRFFAFGCGAILVLGVVLVLMRIFTQ
jgi:hypothetical protein